MLFRLASIAVAVALAMAAGEALGQPEPPPKRLNFQGVAYGFSLNGDDGFSLTTTLIRFLTKGALESADVFGTLSASQATGGDIAVEIDPSQGGIDEKNLRAVFPALRIFSANQAINVARGPEPGSSPPRTLAEGVALIEARRDAAARPFIEQTLADPSVSPRLKALAYRMRGILRARATTDSLDQPTLDGDRARISGLEDIDRAASLAPDDLETALVKSEILDGLGANQEALAGLRSLPDPVRDVWRIGFSVRVLMQMGRFEEALAAEDEIAKRNHGSVGMSYRYNRGLILLRLERFDDAAREFKQGLAWSPNYWPAYVGRACAFAKQGRLQEAERDYAEGRRLMLAQAAKRAVPQPSRVEQWMLRAGPKLQSALASNPHAPDDIPCMPIAPGRERSPLLLGRAGAGATPPKPGP